MVMPPAPLDPPFRHLTARRLVRTLVVLSAILLGVMGLALVTGSTGVRWDAEVVLGARLPRVLLAVLVGASLASAGTVFQALLRNSLADPFILGVSGGAAVGAVAAILSGVVVRAATPFASFAGALGATVLVYALASSRRGPTGDRLLLTGVVVNAFLSALILLLNHLAPPDRRLQIIKWLMGDLGALHVGAAEIATVAVLAGAGLAVFIAVARDLDLMTMGDAAALHLGVDVARARMLAFFAGSLVTGAAVSMCGLIGFVGLIVPHALRLVLGPDHRLLVPASFLGGASFLVLADAAARSLASSRSPEELPVGVITALCGGPFFLFLLVSRRWAA
jgi:iron complex transport system permease protein